MNKVKSKSIIVFGIIVMLAIAALVIVACAPSGKADDKAEPSSVAYLIPVAAWHATNDAASSMSPLVYDKAYIQTTEGEASIFTIYFVSGEMYGTTYNPDIITMLKVRDVLQDEYASATLTYDRATNVNKAVFELAESDLSSLQYMDSVIEYMGREASIRLKFDSSQLVQGNEPQFDPVEEGNMDGDEDEDEGENDGFGDELEVGKSYIATAVAMHLTENRPSEMAPMLSRDVSLVVGEQSSEITLYLVATSIQGFEVSPAPDSIYDLQYMTGGKYVAVTSASYNKFADVMSVTMTVEKLHEYTTMKMAVGAMGGAYVEVRIQLSLDDVYESSDKPSFAIATGNYVVPVDMWQAAKDEPSSVHSFLSKIAYVQVGKDGRTVVTVYFVKGGTTHVPDATYDASVIKGLSVVDISTAKDAIAELEYYAIANINKAVFILDTVAISNVEFLNASLTYDITGSRSTTSGIRLKLDMLDIELGSEPTFDFEVEKGRYSVPVDMWHASNNAPSGAASYLDKTAYVTIGDSSEIEFELYFVGSSQYPVQDLIKGLAVQGMDVDMEYVLELDMIRAVFVLDIAEISHIDFVEAVLTYAVGEWVSSPSVRLKFEMLAIYRV